MVRRYWQQQQQQSHLSPAVMRTEKQINDRRKEKKNVSYIDAQIFQQQTIGQSVCSTCTSVLNLYCHR